MDSFKQVFSQVLETPSDEEVILELPQQSVMELRCDEVVSSEDSDSSGSEDTIDLNNDNLAQMPEDNLYRHFVGLGLYYDWANGYINRASNSDCFLEHFNKNSPFVATPDEVEQFEKEARITCEILGLSDTEQRLEADAEPIVDFGFRKLNTELNEVNKYVPFMHRKLAYFQNRRGLKHESWDCLCQPKWEDFLTEIQLHDLDKIIANWFNCLERSGPVTFEQLLDDVENRFTFACGKRLIMASGNYDGERVAFFNRFQHRECALEWRSLDTDSLEFNQNFCICCQLLDHKLRFRKSKWCCYTCTSAGDEFGVDEVLEIIRNIQMLYLPLTGKDPMFLSADRFTLMSLQGLIYSPNVSFEELFFNSKDYLLPDENQTFLMQMLTHLLLVCETFNRPSSRSMFKWECFDVFELLPQPFYETCILDKLPHCLDYVFQKMYAQGETNGWWQDVLGEDALEFALHCVVRAVQDRYENNCEFECDVCGHIVSAISFVMLKVDIAGLSRMGDIYLDALDYGLADKLFCNVACDDDIRRSKDNGAVDLADHVFSHDCCTFHEHLYLAKIQYDTSVYERVCWDCVKNKQDFLFLGHSTLDTVDDTTFHEGSFWFDMRRVRAKVPKSTKSARF